MALQLESRHRTLGIKQIIFYDNYTSHKFRRYARNRY